MWLLTMPGELSSHCAESSLSQCSCSEVVPVCQPHSPASKSQLNSTSGLVSVVVEVASPCTLHTGASLLTIVTVQHTLLTCSPG